MRPEVKIGGGWVGMRQYAIDWQVEQLRRIKNNEPTMDGQDWTLEDEGQLVDSIEWLVLDLVEYKKNHKDESEGSE